MCNGGSSLEVTNEAFSFTATSKTIDILTMGSSFKYYKFITIAPVVYYLCILYNYVVYVHVLFVESTSYCT